MDGTELKLVLVIGVGFAFSLRGLFSSSFFISTLDGAEPVGATDDIGGYDDDDDFAFSFVLDLTKLNPEAVDAFEDDI